MNADEKPDPLEKTEEIFNFLQGKIPEGYTVRKKLQPRLTPDQAWTVIWFIGNQYFKIPDFIERCDVCGELFNSEASGDCLDYGRGPCHFCDNCIHSDEFTAKMRRHPDKKQRDEFFRR